jgi:hypothetical protein
MSMINQILAGGGCAALFLSVAATHTSAADSFWSVIIYIGIRHPLAGEVVEQRLPQLGPA